MPDINGNGRDVRMVPIRLGDALMLMEAMRLAGNTAMMSGQKDAEARLREYQKMFDDLVPAGARIFNGEVWAEINMALAEATSFDVYIAKDQHRYDYTKRCYTGHLYVQVGDKQWRSKDWDIQENGPKMTDVIAVLQELAPIDCIRKIAEDAD